MPDLFGKLVAASMLGGGAYGFYIKAPAAWAGAGVAYGLASYAGSNMTAKNPENVYLQLTLSSMYVYATSQELYVRPKLMPLFAPLIGIAGLNSARCLYTLWNKEEPIRQV